MTRTDAPCRDSARAAARPASPAPATRTRAPRSRVDSGTLRQRFLAQLRQHCIDHLAGVAKKHLRVLFVKQRILDAGVAASHASLENDAGLRLPYLQDRHPEDRARRVVERAGINDVVGADD